jgi:hypothetical protein
MTEESRFDSLKVLEFLLRNVLTGRGSSKAPVQRVSGALSAVIEWPFV